MIVTKEMGFIPEDTTITRYNPIFIDVHSKPFKIYGVDKKDFSRLPLEVALKTNDAVINNCRTGNGGRIRFRTDSEYVVVHAKIKASKANFHQTQLNASGVDMLIRTDGDWFIPGIALPSQGDGKDYMEYRTTFDPSLGMKDVMLHLPLDSQVEFLSVALREGSVLEECKEYRYTTPIYFYGSSITQGACASKPANTYCAMVSRMLDSDFVNLGFGSGCKGDDGMIDYIREQKMSVFVYDYDHNAPDPDYLKKTHLRGYLRFREKQPDTPVIMASKPDYFYDIFTSDKEVNKTRREIILETYNKAHSLGDKRVSFVDGKTIYPKEMLSFCSTDGCHPNDLGYMYMAKAFSKEIQKYL